MTDHSTAFVGASIEVEDTLLGIVRDLLQNPSIKPEDDFFLAGGYSLLGTQLVIRARKTFGVKVALHDLFDAGSVARLAVRIEELIVEEIDALSADGAHFAASSVQA